MSPRIPNRLNKPRSSASASASAGEVRPPNPSVPQTVEAAQAAPNSVLPAAAPCGPHRLQKQALASGERDPADRLKFALSSYRLAFPQMKGVASVENDERMLKIGNAVIREVDALSPSLRESVLVDAAVAIILVERSQFRNAILQARGISPQFLLSHAKEVVKKLTLQEPNAHAELKQWLSQMDDLFTEHLANASDLRRALLLDTSLHAQMFDDVHTVPNAIKIQSERAVALKRVSMALLTASQLYSWDAARMLGAQGTMFLRFSEKLTWALTSVSLVNFAPLSQESIRLVYPLMDDVVSVCLDFSAFAIELELPEPSAQHDVEEIARAHDWIETAVSHCADLHHAVTHWRQDNAQVIAQASSFHPQAGDFLTLLGPTGLHVLAQMKTDGSAIALNNSDLCFAYVQGKFRVIDEADSEVDLEEGEVDIEISRDTEIARGDTQDEINRPIKAVSNHIKRLQKAQHYLQNKSIEQQQGYLAAGKGADNPDSLCGAYGWLAEKCQSQSGSLASLADQLERFEQDSELTSEQQAARADLLPRLRARAAELTAKAQDFLSPQIRWSLIKAYGQVQASQWAELLKAGEIEHISDPVALPSRPDEFLYEVRIDAKGDASTANYPPVWLHLHARQAMDTAALRDASLDKFHAVHLKSHATRGHGRQWEEAQRASGRYDANVVRSPVNEQLLKGLMQFGTTKP
jgi:hypothetical protein